jgi:hypothetical protein
MRAMLASAVSQWLSLIGELSGRAQAIEIVGDFSAALMLDQQHINEFLVRAARLAHLREDVLLLERALVVLLAEFPEQLGGIGQPGGIDRSAVGAEPA